MNLLQRLYLKDFFRLLLLIGLGLSLIFSLIDLIGNIADFLPGKPSAGALGLYAFYSLPKFFLYLLPMSAFICSLFTFSQAARRKEIVAVKAAGGKLRDLFMPFVATGVIISASAFLIGEFIVPDFSSKAIRLKNRLEGKAKKSSFADGTIWIRDGKGNPVKMDLYLPEKKTAYDISIFISGDAFIKKIIRGSSASWNGSTWTIEGVTLYDSEAGSIAKLDRMDYADLESPDIFSHDIRTADEMGILELFRYMKRLHAAGFSNVKLLVDFNSKISFPLINVFMMLLGISLSARGRSGEGLFTAGVGLATSLLYWFSYSFMLSFGYAAIIPPVIAAWTIPILFGSLAVYLFVKIPE